MEMPSMYDPFASQPPPGTMGTTAVQAMPPTYAPTNALAAIQGKHFRAMGQGPQMYPGGPNGQFPLNPGGQDQQQGFDRRGYHQAVQDWRGQRPDRPQFDMSQFGNMQDWRSQLAQGEMPANLPPEVQQYISAMQDWRGDRPTRGTWAPPTTVG
jgi:hypothetical protein